MGVPVITLDGGEGTGSRREAQTARAVKGLQTAERNLE